MITIVRTCDFHFTSHFAHNCKFKLDFQIWILMVLICMPRCNTSYRFSCFTVVFCFWLWQVHLTSRRTTSLITISCSRDLFRNLFIWMKSRQKSLKLQKQSLSKFLFHTQLRYDKTILISSDDLSSFQRQAAQLRFRELPKNTLINQQPKLLIKIIARSNWTHDGFCKLFT